jgi:hypothetical protein
VLATGSSRPTVSRAIGTPRWYTAIVTVIVLLPLSTVPIESKLWGDSKRPFQVGERLTYKVSWLNMTAGLISVVANLVEGLEKAQL